MNLLRTPGLDLTVFPEDTPVLHTKEQMIEAASQGAASFVRSIAVDIPRDLSLRGALDLVDEQVSVINELTRTTTIDYEWGLVRATPENTHGRRYGRSGEHLVPKGHILAASVEVVQGTTMSAWDAWAGTNDPLTTKLIDDLREYEQTYRGRYYLGDISVGQFIRPSTLDSTGKDPRPVLVDIEPRIAKQRLLTRYLGRRAPPPSEGMLWIQKHTNTKHFTNIILKCIEYSRKLRK